MPYCITRSRTDALITGAKSDGFRAAFYSS
jgi:hypothetical protein